MIKITFDSLKVLQNKINRAKNKIDSKVYSDLQQEADYIEAMSKSNAPYDTGELSRSQFREERLKNGKSIIKIGFTAEYAPFQEFGTGKKFRLNAEYSEFLDFALKFKRGTPILSVKPRRYFLHYYIISRRKLNRKTSTMMKNIFK